MSAPREIHILCTVAYARLKMDVVNAKGKLRRDLARPNAPVTLNGRAHTRHHCTAVRCGRVATAVFPLHLHYLRYFPVSLGLYFRDTLIMAPANTEQSFRTNLSQFRWARDQQQQQQQEQQGTGAGGAFGRFYSSIGISDYVPLRSNERSNEDEAYFALSRWERCVLLCSDGCICWDSGGCTACGLESIVA